MSFTSDLRYELADINAITNLVSDRIYPVIDNGQQLPSMVYNVSDGITPRGFASTALPKEYSVQIDYYTKTYSEIDDVRDALITNFHRFRGSIGAGNQTDVFRSYVESLDDGIEPEETDTYRLTAILTFMTS